MTKKKEIKDIMRWEDMLPCQGPSYLSKLHQNYCIVKTIAYDFKNELMFFYLTSLQ